MVRLVAQAEAKAEESAEKARMRQVRNLEEGGLVFYAQYGGRRSGFSAYTYNRIQTTIAVIKSDLPLEVKAANIKTLWDFGAHRKSSWMVLANFRDVDAVARRVKADIERVKMESELQDVKMESELRDLLDRHR